MRSTILCIALAASASALSAQSVLLLPDNHHLHESATQQALFSTTNWWGTTAAGRRFQVLYEASHFTGKAGVAGPVTLTHLRFRGEDGERNTGGQTYGSVTVNVCKTSTTAAGMSSTFATNLPPSLGGTSGTTTALGSTLIPTVTVAASDGTVPNNWMIDLDLTGAALAAFDPLGDALGEVNLLVDIVWTSYTAGPPIPPATALIAMVPTQDTTAHGAGIRGAGRYATTSTATTGTTANPPVIGVEFVGGGGYATLIPAKTEYIGASCGGQTSGFYQLFPNGNHFDLAGTTLTLTPDNPLAPNFYIVAAGGPAVDLTKVNVSPNSTTDDALVTHALGYTFNYPGGSTTTIKPCTNGFVWLDSAMTATDYNPTLVEWLGNAPSATVYTARVAPLWHDFVASRNTLSHPNCGLHVLNDTSGGPGNTVTYVTWLDDSTINCVTGGGQSVCTMQCVFFEATGVIEFRYGSFTELSGTTTTLSNILGITGFTRGRIAGVNSLDPQSRDLSHEAFFGFATGAEVAANPHITATSTPLAADPTYGARMFGGQSLTFNVSNIPAGTGLMWINLDLVASSPGIPFLTAPGCTWGTGILPLIIAWDSAFLPGPTFTGTVPLGVPHLVWDGLTVTAQAMEIDIFGGPNLIKWTSDTMKFTVGLD